MSSGVQCPYCATVNPSRTIRRTTSLDWTLRFVSRRSATTQEAESFRIKCGVCKHEYEWFEVADTSWLRQHLSVTNTALQDIKTIYSVKKVDYDAIFASVSVLTR